MESAIPGRGPRPELLGRADECALLDGLVYDIGRGESRSLILRGEAGIGKTALLEYLIAAASDLMVVRAAGVESEIELAHAGLHQLCGPLLPRLGSLPGPQRQALEVVFGLSARPAPDRFLVALAVLSLLSEASEERPVLCVVDDAQWLDQASALALAFVARRLLAEPVGLVFATRQPGDGLRDLPCLDVGGLRGGDARALLASAVRFRLDKQVRDRIVAETRGNPLALLELPRGLSDTEFAGFGPAATISGLPDGLEESFRSRIRALPPESRRLLLIAAADPLGEPVLLWRSAELQGISTEAAAPAVEAELCEFGVRVRFRHPLVRAAAYSAASLDERRRAHAALAEATDAEADPDRRAWHHALASAGPDEVDLRDLLVQLVQVRPHAHPEFDRCHTTIQRAGPRESNIGQLGARPLTQPGTRTGHVLASSALHQLDHLLAHPVQIGAQLHQHLRGHAVTFPHEAEQDVLGADVVLAELRRLTQRQLKHRARISAGHPVP